MSTKEIAALVDEAIRIDRRIAEDEARLKGLKADLVALGQDAPESARTVTEGGGWSVVYEGREGDVARVTQPGPKLKATVDAEKPAGARLKQRIGQMWAQLFTASVKYSPVENFRERVAELFKPGEAKAILKAMTTESAPSVSFETKERGAAG